MVSRLMDMTAGIRATLQKRRFPLSGRRGLAIDAGTENVGLDTMRAFLLRCCGVGLVSVRRRRAIEGNRVTWTKACSLRPEFEAHLTDARGKGRTRCSRRCRRFRRLRHRRIRKTFFDGGFDFVCDVGNVGPGRSCTRSRRGASLVRMVRSWAGGPVGSREVGVGEPLVVRGRDRCPAPVSADETSVLKRGPIGAGSTLRYGSPLKGDLKPRLRGDNRLRRPATPVKRGRKHHHSNK